MNANPARAKEIFAAALQWPAEQWDAYLEEVCGGDACLRRRVHDLLQAHARPGSFLEPPEAAPDAIIDDPVLTERPGTVIGPYKLMEQIGEGGMGLVFVAEQQQPIRRKVALKVIKPGMDTHQVIARFEAERQALALMDHPNIAKVLDAGTTGAGVPPSAGSSAAASQDRLKPGLQPRGRPYFVMELVRGIPITEFCDENRLTPRQRLELFVPVCQAVQHAHQKGIIHRDLKPSNVLVTLHDGTPVVKVIDFGVAKAIGQQLTEKTVYTRFTQMIGTPLYMSPEQAEMSGLDIDTRTDVYALGVLLYELLTGTTPFDSERLQTAGFDEMRRIIREEEPAKPSTRISTLGQAATTVSAKRRSDPRRLSQLFRGDLDWIVMKAVEKDRNRRYETASAFAADVQRYLHDEPVQACPPSAIYRLRKFARRNRRRLVMAAVLGLALLVGVSGIGWTALDRAARRAKATNDLELALDRAELYLNDGKRAEALAALERAELLAGEAGPDPARGARLTALRERLDAAGRDQEFIARFEEILLRVQSRVNVEENQFTPEAALPEIRDALRRYGMEIGVMAPAEAAALVETRPEPIRRSLVAALDECVKWTRKENAKTRAWLLTVLAAADNDDWRAQARKALLGGDWPELEQQAREVDERKQPPSFLILVARSLPAQWKSTRLELLRRTQRAYPGDLWANHHLANELVANGDLAEAIRYYTAALALRPDSAGVYLNRGYALERLGEVDAAIADAQQSIALAPEYSMAHSHLGLALWDKGRLDEAIAECREAIRLDKNNAAAHTNLGLALQSKGRLDEAIAEYREAIEINENLPKVHCKAHYNLGNALREKGDFPGAIAEYRQAIALDPDYAFAHCNLGLALWRYQGEFRQALEELRRGHELGAKDSRWRYPSAQWVRQCERLVELDTRLPDFLAGNATPASPAERIELAGLCSLKRLHGAATRFYEQAFAADPKLAEHVDAHRYNAACAAALAGCGQGKDADQLEDSERRSLRRQALDWLRADLAAWERVLEKQPKDRPAATVTKALQHWLVDPDFAGVRGPQTLAMLTDAERQPWQDLWDRVAATVARATATPEKKGAK
jgi:serine/threonine-protein kinase